MNESINRNKIVPTEGERLELERYLAQSHKPLLFGHISPDGDSIGSVQALLHILEARGKKPWATMAGHIPNTLTWLPGNERIMMVVGEAYPPMLDTALDEADLFIFLDLNVPTRIGRVLHEKLQVALAKKPRPLIGIDHHVDPSPAFDFIVSKPHAAATCEIVTELFMQRNPSLGSGEITPVVATCLLTGIITDTGLFNHSSSYPEIFEVAAELMRCGAEKTRIINKVFHSHSLNRFKLEGFVQHEKITFDNELKLGYFSLSLAEQEAFSLTPGDTEGLVNMPLNVEGIEICAFFKETLYEGVKVSLRSKGNLVVNDIARDGFGGGGHKYAAGAEFAGSIEEAQERFLDFVRQHKLAEIKAMDNRNTSIQ